MARVDAEDFVNEESGIFEITALSSCAPDNEDGWGAIIGFVLVWALFGAVTLLAYWHAVTP
jgi:hypothetical protein